MYYGKLKESDTYKTLYLLSNSKIAFVSGEKPAEKGFFYECKSLSEFNCNNIDTSNLGDFKNMFYDCQSLVNLDLSVFNTKKAESMNCMFAGCKNMKTLNISNFFASDYLKTYSGGFDFMFYKCSSLTTIYASNDFDLSSVTSSGGDMFFDCTSLVGEKGTTYTAEGKGKSTTYARIDGGESNPGYFSKAPIELKYDSATGLMKSGQIDEMSVDTYTFAFTNDGDAMSKTWTQFYLDDSSGILDIIDSAKVEANDADVPCTYDSENKMLKFNISVTEITNVKIKITTKVEATMLNAYVGY